MNQENIKAESNLFTKYEWYIFWIIALAGIIIRWHALDVRPFHHDESLHATYGRYYYDDPVNGYYKYSAMLHGPFLYNVYSLVYNILGVTDLATRAPMALIGSLLIFAPLLFGKFLHRWSILALCATISLSPTLGYWSRFAREEMYILASMFLMLYGAVLCKSSLRSFFIITGLTLQFCIKENAYVTVAILLGYLIFEFGFNALVLGEMNSLARKMVDNLKKFRWHFLFSLAVGALIYCYFYSAGFRYRQGILDGIYRESLSYWFEHHNMERIKGPFLFHFYMYAWYELPFILIFLFQIFHFYKRASWNYRIAGIATWSIALFAAVIGFGRPVTESPFFQLFKLKDNLDALGLFVLITHPLILTIYHLNKKEQMLAFWGYFFTATFFTYSYLGEKVPWLATYPYVFGIIYLTLYFQEFLYKNPLKDYKSISWGTTLTYLGALAGSLGVIFMIQEAGLVGILSKDRTLITRSTQFFVFLGIGLLAIGFAEKKFKDLGNYNLAYMLFAVVALFNLRLSIITNHTRAGQPSEYICQVHTTYEFQNIVNKIKDEINFPLRGYKLKVLGIEDSVWPITWYLRNMPEYQFDAPLDQRSNYDYILQNYVEPPVNVPPGFKVMQITLRGWWVPDFTKMNLKNFLNYAINHTPWSDVGYSYLHLLTKER